MNKDRLEREALKEEVLQIISESNKRTKRTHQGHLTPLVKRIGEDGVYSIEIFWKLVKEENDRKNLEAYRSF